MLNTILLVLNIFGIVLSIILSYFFFVIPLQNLASRTMTFIDETNIFANQLAAVPCNFANELFNIPIPGLQFKQQACETFSAVCSYDPNVPSGVAGTPGTCTFIGIPPITI
ncbi:Transmembrane domain-containing protein [Orpheovirus IHUMI-LCC2]|uniref:Transmembrane domain-containing protein n=1 Tax=Orpheovirus IHUMI-LCC2 TaxID=2023057 RepID=A0A2I2L5R4_9VIRU|nr:Transmembrane domain-containing protein [Orpheovirus IHUMI-LCC2]SNW62873.1 Transmembrane domain-containing protein [Orpheovirus IHUMI-LCC2]